MGASAPNSALQEATSSTAMTGAQARRLPPLRTGADGLPVSGRDAKIPHLRCNDALSYSRQQGSPANARLQIRTTSPRSRSRAVTRARSPKLSRMR